MRYTVVVLLLTAAPVAAQYPYSPPAGYGQGYYGQGYPNYAPNFYNRANQPLSPYLNLLRGNANPAVNYYYGARPGLPSGGANNFGQFPPFQQPTGPLYGGFLPQAQIPFDPSGQTTYEPGGVPVRLNSPGHPVVYGNQFGNNGSYYSVYAQNFNRGGFGQRPGQGGTALGNANANRTRQTSTGTGTGGRPPGITAYP